MNKFDQIYAQMPVSLQNLSFSAYGLYWRWLRFGGDYAQRIQPYRDRESFTQLEWAVYEHDQLTQLLSFCADHIPFYHQTWSEAQKAAARQGDLSKLLILEKDDLRTRPKFFMQDQSRHWDLHTYYTSGTTGTPIKSIWTTSETRESMAFRQARSLDWAGVSFDMPRATCSGRIIEPDPQSKGPYHRFNTTEKQLYLSAYHLRPENAKQYVNALWKHQPQWLIGYASSWYLLSKFILEQHLEVPPIQALITTSDKLTPEMRKPMELAYGCRVFEEYSTVESALFASECEHGRLHVSPDVGKIEILRQDGSPCAPGEIGEIVTTCLFRRLQPLIRFRLGDLAAWDTEACPCGRAMPVIKEVVGRVEDVVIGPDGRQTFRLDRVFVGQPHVIEGQIIQKTLSQFIVNVVPAEHFNEVDRASLTALLRQRLGDAVQVQVELVDSLERTKAGKVKGVISEVTQ